MLLPVGRFLGQIRGPNNWCQFILLTCAGGQSIDLGGVTPTEYGTVTKLGLQAWPSVFCFVSGSDCDKRDVTAEAQLQ
jgi:hypothetical protein